MGHLAEHVCDSCGYRATVSGGSDAGMAAITETMACRACHEVVDVVVAIPPYGAESPVAHECPECEAGGEALERWRTGDRCPRCDGTMTIDPEGEFVLWD